MYPPVTFDGRAMGRQATLGAGRAAVTRSGCNQKLVDWPTSIELVEKRQSHSLQEVSFWIYIALSHWFINIFTRLPTIIQLG